VRCSLHLVQSVDLLLFAARLAARASPHGQYAFLLPSFVNPRASCRYPQQIHALSRLPLSSQAPRLPTPSSNWTCLCRHRPLLWLPANAGPHLVWRRLCPDVFQPCLPALPSFPPACLPPSPYVPLLQLLRAFSHHQTYIHATSPPTLFFAAFPPTTLPPSLLPPLPLSYVPQTRHKRPPLPYFLGWAF
jgi:hypothetical protein